MWYACTFVQGILQSICCSDRSPEPRELPGCRSSDQTHEISGSKAARSFCTSRSYIKTPTVVSLTLTNRKQKHKISLSMVKLQGISHLVTFSLHFFKGFFITAYIKGLWTCCCSEHPAQLLLTPRGIQHTVKPAKDTWELEERWSCWEGNKCELSFSPSLSLLLIISASATFSTFPLFQICHPSAISHSFLRDLKPFHVTNLSMTF